LGLPTGAVLSTTVVLRSTVVVVLASTRTSPCW
jgi:hypothetical protein